MTNPPVDIPPVETALPVDTTLSLDTTPAGSVDEPPAPYAAPVAVVTGASAGVGRATVRALADAGYDVACIARGRAGLLGAVADVEARGRRGLAVAVDVADWDGMREAARRIEDCLGPIEVWVNDAMTTVFGHLRDIDPAEIRRATEVTYLGQVHGAMAALEHMRPRDRGVIVSVGSALAFRAIPLQAPYCGAKFATRGFMEALRTELIADDSAIRIANVHLPAVNTPQFGWCRNHLPDHPHPVAPVYSPELAARAIVAAAMSPRRRVIVGVWNRMLIQANKVAPGVLDHYAARTAVDGQQTTDHVRGDGDNLCAPRDDVRDHGAHGVFDAEQGGMVSTVFLRTLPEVAKSIGNALAARALEVRDQYRPGRSNRGTTPTSGPSGSASVSR